MSTWGFYFMVHSCSTKHSLKYNLLVLVTAPGLAQPRELVSHGALSRFPKGSEEVPRNSSALAAQARRKPARGFREGRSARGAASGGDGLRKGRRVRGEGRACGRCPEAAALARPRYAVLLLWKPRAGAGLRGPLGLAPARSDGHARVVAVGLGRASSPCPAQVCAEWCWEPSARVQTGRKESNAGNLIRNERGSCSLAIYLSPFLFCCSTYQDSSGYWSVPSHFS